MRRARSLLPKRNNEMTFETANEAKAAFDDVYTAETPHAYIASMAKVGYQIGEQARPYCTGAAELLRESNGETLPVQMLDVGCSYGMGSAFVKYGCSFDEMVAFFASRAPTEYVAACEATRMWLHVTPPACDVRCVGLDSSAPAIRFALDADLLDGGLAKDFEDSKTSPTPEDRAWFRSCNLMISTGAIGYVTEKTLDVVLRDLGRDNPAPVGPFAILTILRMFEHAAIKDVFGKHGFRFGVVPDVRLPQRRFVDDAEQQKVLALLHQKGIDTYGWEDQGKQFADLYIAARPENFDALFERMRSIRSAVANGSGATSYIRR